jgi:hypothetical protein
VNDAPSFTKGANQTVNEDAGPQSVASWATGILAGPANEGSQTVAFLIDSNSNVALFSTAPAVSSTGTLTYTPAANANGSATIVLHAHDNGGTANGGIDNSATQTFTITVTADNDAPIVVNDSPTAPDQSTQFSDAFTSVKITATDLDSPDTSLTLDPTKASYVYTPLGGSAQPKVYGLPAGFDLPLAAPVSTPGTSSATPGVLSPPSKREWTLAGRMIVPAGSYAITVPVSDGSKLGSTTFTIVVNKEDAAIEYSGDVFKNATSSTSLNLAAVVREAGVTGSGIGESPALLGNQLAGRTVTFNLYTFTGTTPYKTCTATIVASATPGTGNAGCQVTSVAIDDNPYRLEIVLNPNLYYAAEEESQAVVVQLAGSGFVTGGGWLNEPNLLSRSNFGFTVKRLKNGNLQGNSIYIYRKVVAANEVPYGTGYLPAGKYNWQIKSNSWSGGGLTQACTTIAPIKCTATFAGKANIKAINRVTGVEYSLGGNYLYQADVDDYSEPGSSPGSGPDRYAIRVWDPTTGTYYQLGSPRTWNPTQLWNTLDTGFGVRLNIVGGNIQVH